MVKPYIAKDGTELGYSDDALLAEYFSMQQRLVNAKVTYTPAQYAQVKAPEDSDFIKDKMAFGIGYSNGAVADSTVKKPKAAEGVYLRIEYNGNYRRTMTLLVLGGNFSYSASIKGLGLIGGRAIYPRIGG